MSAVIACQSFGLLTVIVPLTSQALSTPAPFTNLIVYLKVAVPPVLVTLVLSTSLLTLHGNFRENEELAVFVTSRSAPTQTSTDWLASPVDSESLVVNVALLSYLVQVPGTPSNSLVYSNFVGLGSLDLTVPREPSTESSTVISSSTLPGSVPVQSTFAVPSALPAASEAPPTVCSGHSIVTVFVCSPASGA